MRSEDTHAVRAAFVAAGLLVSVLAGCRGDGPATVGPAATADPPATAVTATDPPAAPSPARSPSGTPLAVDPVTAPPKAPDRAAAEETDPPAATPNTERSAEATDPTTDGPPATDGAVVHAYAAMPRRRLVDIYREPGSPQPRYAFDVENPFGQRAPLLVERGMRDTEGERWVRVQLPIRPNGTTGWVRVDQVRLLARDELIVVDLSERRLRHYVAGRLSHVFRVGIGRPDAPSARGLFSVWARVPQTDAAGPYGTFVLGLSGLAPISEWTGQGRMAIHGTGDPADRGRRVSSGCVRVFNPQMERLTGVPLGTPVVIRA